MLYILTNIGACLGVAILFYLGVLLDYKNWKKISILTITIISLLVALSVILTNVISYNIPFPFIRGEVIQLALGNFLIFVIGMLFGPFLGVLSGLAADALVGVLVNIGGTYHSGFSFNLALCGFLGSVVFLFKNDKFWILKTIILYAIGFALISFAFNVLWLYAIGLKQILFPMAFVIKAIKFPIQLAIYLPIVISSFTILYKLIISRHNLSLWCTQKGLLILTPIKFKKQKRYNS